MATKIIPPVYSKSKSYERYKQELLAWREITDLSKVKQGIAIALSLPEDDPTGIREKVFDQLSLASLKLTSGLETLIKFLDKHLAKDDLADSLEKFEDFEDCHRDNGETIIEYIARFDSKYKKIEKKYMVLPSEILAFKLLRKANLSKQEKLLVLTGMDYENRDGLYEQAQKSLKKFKGDVTKSDSQKESIMLEPTYVAEEDDEVLWTSGQYKFNGNRRGGPPSRRGFSSTRGSGRFRGGPSKFNQNNRSSYGYNSSGSNNGSHNGSNGSWKRGGGYKRTMPERPMNPSAEDGSILTCKACGSFRHMVSSCPHSWENLNKVHITENVNSEVNSEEHAVLFTGFDKQSLAQLDLEARSCAVLDSACSSTVCGQKWLESYIDSMDHTDKEKIIRRDGHKVFKFGGGTKLKSLAEYEVPANLAGKQVKIKTDVVESDIPMLLSRSAMKDAQIKLDLVNDTAEIFGEDVTLNFTSSGHYCVPIDRQENVSVENVCAVNLESLSPDDCYKTLLKLHRQFAHPPEKRLVALLKDAGVWEDKYKEVLAQIQSNCDLCKVYSKTPSRPVVSFPMASEFNEKVAMDLKKWGDSWILHMIDMWSRYTMSVFIKRKRPKDVIEAIMANWIGIFGVMKSVLTDNGGEFSSDEMREVASILNVQVCTTAGESPFQNGLCERVHAVTDTMLSKLQDQYGQANNAALLCWANMARNALQMWNGFSSHQLVFGQNPNLPNIMQSTLPALDGSTTSEVFAKHLNALHASRKAYIATEADEKIRRALRHKVRAAEQVFSHGDLVFYKREGRDKWLGPGKVVFQDGKVIFVRHGGIFVRVSPNRLVKASGVLYDAENSESDNQNSDVQTESNDSHIQTENISERFVNSDSRDSSQNQIEFSSLPKINDKIKYKSENSDNWITASVISHAGKVTGCHKNWFNIKLEDTAEEKSVDFGNVAWEIIHPEEVNAVIIPKMRHEDLECLNAKNAELEKLKHFGTYKEVKDTGQAVISTKWVLTQKGNQVKARLVARGFEEDNYIQSDSPTVGKSVMKIFLSVASSMNWSILTTDIKSAFLQGKKLERDVFLVPPAESKTQNGFIWKLERCLYGLNDGARQFYLSVKDELIHLGCTQSSLDPALFYMKKDNHLIGMVCCHVDDFLHAGEKCFDKHVMFELRKRFLAGKIEANHFKYVGFNILQDKSGIIIDQSDYIKNMENGVISPQRATEKHEALDKNEQTLLRQLVGRINWVVQGSRPDVAFEMIDLSTKLKGGTINDLLRAFKVIRHLKDTLSLVKFSPLTKEKNRWKIVVFSDASHANINDGTGSVGAHIIWLTDESENSCPIAWHANKVKRVVRSTIAAETLALQEGLEDAVYLRRVLEELLGCKNNSIPIVGFVDNKSVVEALYSTKLVDDKRLRLDMAAIRQSLDNGEVHTIKWCPGEFQLANSMTKRGASGYTLLSTLQKGKLKI